MSKISLLKETTIAHRNVNFAKLPKGLRVDETLALVLGASAITGQVVHTATGSLFETRATGEEGLNSLLLAEATINRLKEQGYSK